MIYTVDRLSSVWSDLSDVWITAVKILGTHYFELVQDTRFCKAHTAMKGPGPNISHWWVLQGVICKPIWLLVFLSLFLFSLPSLSMYPRVVGVFQYIWGLFFFHVYRIYSTEGWVGAWISQIREKGRKYQQIYIFFMLGWLGFGYCFALCWVDGINCCLELVWINLIAFFRRQK